jgi:tryptophan synthase
MSQAIRDVFERKSKENKTVFVAFVTAGFPTREETVSIMLGLEKGGADIIELGVPHSGSLLFQLRCLQKAPGLFRP